MSDMMNTTSTASAEIQHTNRAHARLNASSSHRWMMCPPSVKLSEQFEDKPSTYAEEGSFLHELCELKLHRYLGDMTAEAVEVQYAEHRDSEFYPEPKDVVLCRVWASAVDAGNQHYRAADVMNTEQVINLPSAIAEM